MTVSTPGKKVRKANSRIAGKGPDRAQRKDAAGCCEVFYVDEDRVARAREAALSDETAYEVAETFKVLANPTRVHILRALAREELCVCDLAQVLGMTISAVSHQLRALRGLRLVRFRMEGKLAYYTLRDPFVLVLVEDCLSHLRGEGTAG